MGFTNLSCGAQGVNFDGSLVWLSANAALSQKHLPASCQLHRQKLLIYPQTLFFIDVYLEI